MAVMKYLLFTIILSAVAGCQPVPTPVERATKRQSHTPVPTTDESVATPDLLDVPRPWAPHESNATRDVDRDLGRVLELEVIKDACKQYRDGDHSERTRLRCGKWMFFYESFGTVGIPSHLLEFFQQWYRPYFGSSFSSMGFVPNPNSRDSMPIGLSESTQRMGSIKVHAFTCASCHFGQMPDGRYAVGYPNNQLDYGRFIASLVALMKLSINPNDNAIHPELKTALSTTVQTARQLNGFMIGLASLGLNIAMRGGDAMSSGALDLTHEEQHRFWHLRTGTMDFLTKPMADDGVWTVSRILSLWNLPTPELIEAKQMPHGLLSWTGIGESLMDFLHGFVAISGSNTEWTDEQLQPLVDYIYSLRAPTALHEIDHDAVERGAKVFAQTGCLDCHDGPSGEGRELYDFEHIGTDPAMRAIYNPDDNGQLCCGLDAAGDQATWSLKSPRLAGQRFRTRLLHNGSLDNLEQLLCLEARPVRNSEAQSATGHLFGCDELTEAEKRDLIDYINHL